LKKTQKQIGTAFPLLAPEKTFARPQSALCLIIVHVAAWILSI